VTFISYTDVKVAVQKMAVFVSMIVEKFYEPGVRLSIELQLRRSR
jgi:hypothetical protein